MDLPPPLKGRDLETTQPKTEPTKSDGAAFVAAAAAAERGVAASVRLA